jgi:hypothetical protein
MEGIRVNDKTKTGSSTKNYRFPPKNLTNGDEWGGSKLGKRAGGKVSNVCVRGVLGGSKRGESRGRERMFSM